MEDIKAPSTLAREIGVNDALVTNAAEVLGIVPVIDHPAGQARRVGFNREQQRRIASAIASGVGRDIQVYRPD